MPPCTPPCKTCGAQGRDLIETNYHTMVCPRCGTENPGNLAPTDGCPFLCVLVPCQTYTRVKRFQKYLNRAGKTPSACSVPTETWRYLMCRGPYTSPVAIVRTLMAAGKRLKKNCYDSLPFLCEHLANLHVPTLTGSDKAQAMVAFRKLDTAYKKGERFVSYLYALEYILVHIGRGDMLPFINKISCKKRRAAYQHRLSRVFSSRPQTPV